MSYEKIEIVKDGNLKKMHYESSDVKINKNLTSEEYNKLFERLEPTTGFSLPDKLIQDFIKDGSMIPSFKKSDNYTNEDLFNIIKPLKKELNYIIERRNKIKDTYKRVKKDKKGKKVKKDKKIKKRKKNKKKYFKSNTKKLMKKKTKMKNKMNKKTEKRKTKKNKK